jgi:hypothetical protein
MEEHGGGAILPPGVDFDTFSARARVIAAEMPPRFMGGIEAVLAHREAKGNPELPEVFTMGECETSPLSDATGTDAFRSIVHLYHGSFAALARTDPSFDWEYELRETIEHEVQHHLEDRAGIKDLRDEDALFDAHARFKAGLEVPPGWYRQGERVGQDLWAVDLDLFLELRMRRKEWDALRGRRIELVVMDDALPVDLPADADPDEVFTLEGEGLFEEDESAEAEGEEAPLGISGDLHVIPIVR